MTIELGKERLPEMRHDKIYIHFFQVILCVYIYSELYVQSAYCTDLIEQLFQTTANV